MKWTLSIASSLIVIAAAILCWQIVAHSMTEQRAKYDYAELHSVEYGLLSVDEWKTKITPIVEAEINSLSVKKAQRRLIKKHVEGMLTTLIDKVYEKLKEENGDSLAGRAKQSLIRAFVKLDDIKKGVPEYADAVMGEMTKPQTQRDLKRVLKQQVRRYANETHAAQDTSLRDRILVRTQSSDVETARAKIAQDVAAARTLVIKQAIALIVLAAALFAMVGLSRTRPLPAVQYLALIAVLGTLLIAGVTTPMIDLEATIPQLKLELLGHPVEFDHQVLYFQSKSILDVFWVMIRDKAWDMKFVGVLLVTFSIAFPLLKILASLAHYYDYRRARDHAVVRFFVFQSGKWSMADVMVVAIFMAYIGFNGIISSEFDDLKAATQDVTLLTTNATSLQPGFYLFLSYTLLALALSFIASHPRTPEPKTAVR